MKAKKVCSSNQTTRAPTTRSANVTHRGYQAQAGERKEGRYCNIVILWSLMTLVVAIDLLSVAAERSSLWSRDLLSVNRQELKVNQQHEDI